MPLQRKNRTYGMKWTYEASRTHSKYLNLGPICPIGPISPILIPESHALTHRSLRPTARYRPRSVSISPFLLPKNQTLTHRSR
jgi:hypothetical protein